MNVGFLFSFTAGLVSVISPCVLPLIPIVVGHSLLRGKIRDVAAFIIGFFMVFAIITVLTAIFTVAINYYLLYFRVIASILIILLGIFFITNKNIFHFITPKHINETMGSFLVGFLTCLAWSPCYGPYLIAVVTYSASSGNWIYSAVNMMLFAAGFSVALFVVAFFASKINFERVMKYSDGIRIFSGIIIIIAGIYMLTGYFRI
jgi:cytochrome c-type biogenesis protein